MMDRNIYKSQSGRDIIEAAVRDILDNYKEYPFEQLYIPTKIGRTHILKFGDGSKPALIMLHGSVSNSAAWLGCISEFITDFCIYCVDLPGEPGLSEPVRCTLHSDEPFEWLDSLFEWLGIKRAFLLTMSLGSWYALNFAVRSPEKVLAMSMITSGGLVQARMSFLLKAVLYLLLGKVGQKMLNRAIYYKTKVPAEMLEFQEIVSKHFNPVMEALPVFSDGDLRKITSPVQFFGGRHDALIDSEKTADRIRSLFPDAEVHVLDDYGHVIIDKFPEVKAFLKKYTD